MVKDLVKKILKERGVTYLYDNGLFELFIGSFNGYIEFETEDFAHYFDDNQDLWYEECYEYNFENVILESNVEDHIDDLITFVKEKARFMHSVKSHLGEIEKIILDSNMPVYELDDIIKTDIDY